MVIKIKRLESRLENMLEYSEINMYMWALCTDPILAAAAPHVPAFYFFPQRLTQRQLSFPPHPHLPEAWDFYSIVSGSRLPSSCSTDLQASPSPWLV